MGVGVMFSQSDLGLSFRVQQSTDKRLTLSGLSFLTGQWDLTSTSCSCP